MKISRNSKTRLLLIILLALGVSISGALRVARPAHAVEFDPDGLIAKGETINDDVFISGETVAIDGTVIGNVNANGSRVLINGAINGDLFVFAADLEMNGTVNGSLFFAGQSAVINGRVDGTLYGAGSTLQVSDGAVIGRNLMFAGFGLAAQPGSQIGKDVYIAAYQGLLYGLVGRHLRADVSALEIGGKVVGNVQANVSAPETGPAFYFTIPSASQRSINTVPSGLRVLEGAQIGGKMSYTSPVDQSQAIKAAPEGGLQFTQTKETPRPDFKASLFSWILNTLQQFVTLLVVGLLAAWLVPTIARCWADKASARPLAALGWGFVSLVGGFTGAFFLAVLILVLGILVWMVTLGGLAQTVIGVGFSGLALAFALFMFLVTYGSKLVVAYAAGQLIFKKLLPQAGDMRFSPMILGVVLYTIFAAIPVLGFLVGVLATLLGLGAIWMAWKEKPVLAIVSTPTPFPAD